MSITRQLIKHVRDLAEENPTFVYQEPGEYGICMYQHDGVPACIIGQAFTRTGTPIEMLIEWDKLTGGKSVSDIAVDHGITSPRVRGWLARVQQGQDHGKTWRDAVRAADTQHPLFNARDYV